MVTGSYEGVFLIEAPEVETPEKPSPATGSRGAVSRHYLHASTEDDCAKMIAVLPRLPTYAESCRALQQLPTHAMPVPPNWDAKDCFTNGRPSNRSFIWKETCCRALRPMNVYPVIPASPLAKSSMVPDPGLLLPSKMLPFFVNSDLCRLRYPIQMKAGIAQIDLPGFGALEIKMQVMLLCEADSTVNLNA